MIKGYTAKRLSRYYSIIAAIVIIGAPVALALLYNWLAGGILNGLAGSWHEAVIQPSIFLLFINPIVMIASYVLLCFAYKNYIADSKSKALKVLSTATFILATAVMLVVVFWGVIT